MKRGLVVEGDLLAWPDVPEGDEENMTIQDFHVGIGFATMVYVMRAIPSLAAVEAPAFINCADT